MKEGGTCLIASSRPFGQPLTLRGVRFPHALFCAPMAGLTHSAFRRLLADFGGYGALFTEMLSGRWLLHENLRTSPSVKRRPQEGHLIYQLMIVEAAEVGPILARLAQVEPVGIDLNCACPAPNIRAVGAGSELFEDGARLAAVLTAVRQHYAGLLTVKIRLGPQRPDWRERIAERFKLFENCGVDAVIVHPRFQEEKLKRRARQEWLNDLAGLTRLPMIASGDITGPQTVAAQPEIFSCLAGVMVGRMAAVQPWTLARWSHDAAAPSYLETWERFFAYACEDFPPAQALRRIQLFTRYFARNFLFGHSLFAATQSAPDLATLRERATRFLARHPQATRVPELQGL